MLLFLTRGLNLVCTPSHMQSMSVPSADFMLPLIPMILFNLGLTNRLRKKQRIKLDQARPVNPDSIDDGFSMEEILEFACPGCEMPIRLIFLASEFAMGCYNYQLLEVVELVQHHKQLSSEEEDSSGGLKDFV